MVEVIAMDEFTAWYVQLDESAAESVGHVVGLLEAKGVLLDHPYSSAINGATFALRELRVQSGGRPLRVFYAFDPKRQAALLLGGDKTGDDRFYERMIRDCERIWRGYMQEF